MRKHWLLFFVWCNIVIVCQCQTNAFVRSDQPAHGTINIILANGNGLVAVADSRLSNNGIPLDTGQKLFKLDERTICVIADFYRDPGPRIDNRFPLRTEVTAIVRYYLGIASEQPRVNPGVIQTVSTKFLRLKTAYESALNLLNAIYAQFGTTHTTGAILTVAGFDEKNELWVEGVTLIPKFNGLAWEMAETDRFDEAVKSDHLLARVKGVDDVWNDFTFDAKYRPERLSKNRLLENLASGMSEDGGKNLTLQDLENSAKEVERLTANKHPNIVGGPQQIAILENGRISTNENVQLLTPLVPGEPTMFNVSFNFNHTFMGNNGPVRGTPRDRINDVYSASFFYKSLVPLDGAIFMNSTFTSCTLLYLGRAPLYFDPNNQIDPPAYKIDDPRFNLSPTVLRLGPNVTEHDSVVENIKLKFPNLKIESVATKGSNLPSGTTNAK